MQRLALSLALLMIASAAVAQTPSNEQAPSPMYPAPPPLKAPEVDKGAPVGNLTSPLAADQAKPAQTKIDSEAEAQLFIHATKMSWGRYSRIKGAKPGLAVVTKQGPVWTIKGRLESVAPGTEGDWASIDGVVERIESGKVQIRGEVAFRVAKLMNGAPCKVGGTLHFRRSGKSHVWRLVEGDNPCDGTQEQFDLIYDKPAEKKPVPAQPKRT